jgi:hypothetical protein
MNGITVKDLPPAVAKAVKEKARKEKLSLNKAIVRLLEEATGTDVGRKKAVHHDLDHLAGTWSEAEYEQFMAALREHCQIDQARHRRFQYDGCVRLFTDEDDSPAS